jgi:Kef-type K+ transport system membrane component KefB
MNLAGVVVLSAGVANDVVGWILLALAVGLVNGGGGIQALYILLTCVAFAIALLTVGRWAIAWLARKTGSIEQGAPSIFFLTTVILVLFGSAFFTDIIGVSSIFGAFLVSESGHVSCISR